MIHALVVVAVAVVLTELAILATTVYLHRTLAHGALRWRPAVDVCFRAILWLTTGLSRQEWVAVHRKHHTFTDREGDPHSPRVVGFWRVQLLNVYYYAREARKPATLRTFAPDLQPDRLERVIFGHGWTGVLLGTGLLCLVVGVPGGVAAALLHGVLYVFVVAPLINGLGHWRGGKNFDNTAFNSATLALFTGGESLHNNHHAHPRAPKFSVRRGEFDPAWPVIRALASVGLGTVVGAPVRVSSPARRMSPALAPVPAPADEGRTLSASPIEGRTLSAPPDGRRGAGAR